MKTANAIESLLKDEGFAVANYGTHVLVYLTNQPVYRASVEQALPFAVRCEPVTTAHGFTGQLVSR